MPSTTGISDPIAGLLCYILGWITGLIFLIVERRSRFVRFHAAQSVIVFSAITVLGIIVPQISYIGGILYALLSAVSFIIWLFMMITAAQGKTIRIPVVAELADQLL